MCQMQALLTISGIWDEMHYVSWLVFVAGSFFGLLGVTMLCRRMWQSSSKKSPSSKEPLGLSYLRILTESRRVELSIAMVCAFIAGMFVQHGREEWQRYNNERSYPIKVIQRLDQRRAYVCKANGIGECVSPQFKFSTCPHEPEPKFEEGKLYDVDFEISDWLGGECNTFTGERGKFKELR